MKEVSVEGRGAAADLRRAEIPPAGLRERAVALRFAVFREFFAAAFFVAIEVPRCFELTPV